MRYPNALTKVLLLLAVVSIPWLALLLDSQGAEAWPVRYNGPGNWDDHPTALALDGQGNVYVTGASYGAQWNSDYATIKYSLTGQRLWVRRYNGPGNGEDSPSALAVDGQGNVYVTGYVVGAGSGGDYTTIKYSPTGVLLWARRYNSPGNGDDYARALAVDAQGNVYVTGASKGGDSGYDYVTIKYASNGSQLWLRRYNGPGNASDGATALAVDAQGNVYVTGYSGPDEDYYDYVTIKYSSTGQRLWVRRYNGPADGHDAAYLLAVDAQGNVYVTGNSDGGASYIDYATIKYNSNGGLLWVRRYNGSANGEDRPRALALDNQGNVYVTGESVGAGSYHDYLTIKYGPTGQRLWAKRYKGTANASDVATALAVDAQGNVYVTGDAQEAGSSPNYTTIKYSPTGVRLWTKRYNGPENGYDAARALAVDAQGNVYVTGTSFQMSSGSDYVTIKYSQ